MATSALQERPQAEPPVRTNGASVIVDNRYLPPPEDKDGKQWKRTSAFVMKPAQELYALWRNLPSIPLWQEQIASVSETGERTSHWVMQVDDKTIEWDSEILADEPGKRIAWHTIGGDIDQAGEVIFEASPSGEGTIVTVLQELRLGKLASALGTLVGRNPRQAIIENLRHFKAFAETGEIPRVQGQPHGPRGTIGGIKKSLYGEKIETPPGALAK